MPPEPSPQLSLELPSEPPRLAPTGFRYCVIEDWRHIFSDGVERGIRAVLDTTSWEVLAMDMQYGDEEEQWVPARQEAIDDVIEDFACNGIYGEIANAPRLALVRPPAPLEEADWGEIPMVGSFVSWDAFREVPPPWAARRVARWEREWEEGED